MHMNCNSMLNCKSLSLRMCSGQVTLQLLTFAASSITSADIDFMTHAAAAKISKTCAALTDACRRGSTGEEGRSAASVFTEPEGSFDIVEGCVVRTLDLASCWRVLSLTKAAGQGEEGQPHDRARRGSHRTGRGRAATGHGEEGQIHAPSFTMLDRTAWSAGAALRSATARFTSDTLLRL